MYLNIIYNLKIKNDLDGQQDQHRTYLIQYICG